MQKKVFIWLICGCILVISMVVVGGITRLTQSGLSITEWKPISGTLPPLSQEAWEAEFELYKSSPEYKRYNLHFSLADYKRIFFWEYIHRLLGRIIGLIFLFPCIYFWTKGAFSSRRKKQVLLIFAGGAFQGFLGWFMVKSGLVDNPHVSHYRLAAHLITAISLAAYIFWVALEIRQSITYAKPVIYRLAWAFLALSSLQIIYGAFVAGLKAGKLYNTYPKMGNKWLPPDASTIFELKGLAAIFESQVMVQWLHRSLAILVLLLAILILYKAYQNHRVLLAPALLLFSSVLLQFSLGVLTLLWAVPISLGVVHQLGAVWVVLACVYLIFKSKPAEFVLFGN